MGEKLRDMLTRSADALADGNFPTDEEMAQLKAGYENAINGASCPCDSGDSYADCCKLEWQAFERGARKMKEEAREEAKRKTRARVVGGGGNGSTKTKRGTPVKWILKVGVGPDGAPIVEPTVNIDPVNMAGILLNAYHRIMGEGIQAAMAGVQQIQGVMRGRPNQIPIK
jgi:hypothetical protein